MDINTSPKTVARWLGILVLFLTLAHLLGYVLEQSTGRTYGLFLFDLDRERNIPAFFGAILLLSSALLLGIVALGHRKNNRPHFYWAGLSLIFLFLALDEAAAIHENLISPVRNALNTSGALYYAWVIPYGLLFLLLVTVYARFVWQLPPKTRLFFIIGGGIFVTGAIGFELIGGYYADIWGTDTTSYALLTMFEEFLEMSGITIFIYALLDYIGQTFPKIQVAVQLPAAPAKTTAIASKKASPIMSEKR
jgi:hypothetical protein